VGIGFVLDAPLEADDFLGSFDMESVAASDEKWATVTQTAGTGHRYAQATVAGMGHLGGDGRDRVTSRSPGSEYARGLLMRNYHRGSGLRRGYSDKRLGISAKKSEFGRDGKPASP
jgi:hypothetical protein